MPNPMKEKPDIDQMQPITLRHGLKLEDGTVLKHVWMRDATNRDSLNVSRDKRLKSPTDEPMYTFLLLSRVCIISLVQPDAEYDELDARKQAAQGPFATLILEDILKLTQYDNQLLNAKYLALNVVGGEFIGAGFSSEQAQSSSEPATEAQSPTKPASEENQDRKQPGSELPSS
jgi:hypothetical protein